MKLVSSFTRGVRYPAPDVVRGLMLLLIALANVPYWTGTMTSPFQQSSQDVAAVTPDSVWLLVRTLVVDHRAYPLFALLFGFGLVTMVNRRIASGTQAYLDSATGGRAELATPAQHAWAQEQATVDARRLVRRRGWWMLLFGAVHGLVFVGDIIGSYGLAAVLFAGWLARKHRRRAAVVSVVVVLLLVAAMVSAGLMMADPAVAEKMGAASSQSSASLWWPLVNVLSWVGTTVSTVMFSLLVPAMFLGARLADTEVLTHPGRYRSRLLAVGVGGLVLGALAALHGGLADLGWADPWVLDMAVAEVLGLAGACGWLALLALYAGDPRPDGGLSGLRRMASAVGRRSMTAYLSQTILFGLLLAVVPAALGVELSMGDAVAGLVAAGVWLVTVVVCLLLERHGRPGPFDVALRTAVARSQRTRRVPPPPPGEASWEQREVQPVPAAAAATLPR